MNSEFLTTLAHFFVMFLATLCALLVIYVVKRKYSGPADPIGFLDWMLDGMRPTKEPAAVNVEYRDASGALMDLGDYVTVRLRNGSGPAYTLKEGCFVGCNPHTIKLGASCVISVQDGLWKEIAPVHLDFQRKVLFIASPLTLEEILRRLNAP